MKTGLKATLPLLLASVLMPIAGFASHEPNTHDLVSQCARSAEGLQDLFHQRNEEACSGEISIAASHVQVAGRQIEHNKYTSAQSSLQSAKWELEKVRMDSHRCHFFAPKVVPFMVDLIRISGELDLIERTALLNQ